MPTVWRQFNNSTMHCIYSNCRHCFPSNVFRDMPVVRLFIVNNRPQCNHRSDCKFTVAPESILNARTFELFSSVLLLVSVRWFSLSVVLSICKFRCFYGKCSIEKCHFRHRKKGESKKNWEECKIVALNHRRWELRRTTLPSTAVHSTAVIDLESSESLE